MDARQMEQLVQAITEEILGYLGTAPKVDLRGLEIDEVVCPGCNQSCAEKCVNKTKRILEAGACRISCGEEIKEIGTDLAGLIDHTLLKPEASRRDVLRICDEAKQFRFASVVVNPWYVPLVAERLRGTAVKVCTVVGFPFGATLPQVKVFETEEVIKLGAQEIDMVVNVGALKSGDLEVVEQDIRGVAEACHRAGCIVKVILEMALLTVGEKVRGCVAAREAGADFVKTSTGFGPGGATAEDVALMRAIVGREIGVKAAGGVRSYEDLQKMICAGATRIGASASVKILEEAREARPS